MPLIVRATALLGALALTGALAGCKEDYDLDEYKEIRDNGELEDVVHEWMHDYIERYCRVERGGSIECE
ncbi:MAG: hypothetical protein ACQEVT_01100 [Pseudomonadota bacterium]